MRTRFLAFCLLALCCGASQAAVTVYSDEAAFLAALTGTSGTEDFESFATISGPLGGPDAAGITLDFGGVNTGSVSYTSGGPTAGMNPDAFVSDWSYAPSPILIPGSNFLNADNVAVGSLSVSFDNPVNAFGFNLYDAGDTGPDGEKKITDPTPTGNLEDFEVVLSNGATFTLPTAGSFSGSSLFFGVITDMGGFNSVSFDQGFQPDLFGIDDLTVQNFAPGPPGGGGVPEPASATVWSALLLTGLALVRRKRKQS